MSDIKDCLTVFEVNKEIYELNKNIYDLNRKIYETNKKSTIPIKIFIM